MRFTYLWDRHSLRMNLHRFLPSEMRPETPMPRWSSILKSFRWKVPISADVLFDRRQDDVCVALHPRAACSTHSTAGHWQVCT